ncbi:hypothetical protein MKX03_025070 [Papaver bracteatum]|nr:hypothetical protein MKX03_025070 [Papaver bracteatum]
MEYVAAPADDSQEQTLCSRLSTHRRKMKYLFLDWGKMEYEEKELVFHSYLHLLYTTELQTILEENIVDGERNYTKYQIAVIHAIKKIGMQLYNEDWVEYLVEANAREPQVVKEANGLGIPINEEILSLKEIRDENPDEVKRRFMVYCKELEEARNMPQDNVDCIARGPKMCELIKTVTSKMSRRHLVESVDDSKRAETKFDGIHIQIRSCKFNSQ